MKSIHVAVFCLLGFAGCATSGVTAQGAAQAAYDCTAPSIAANVANIITAIQDVKNGVAVPADVQAALIGAGEADLRCAIEAIAKQ